MFLQMLNKQQQELFYELAIKAAEADGIIASEEKNLLNLYAKEINVSPKYSTERVIGDVTNEIAICSNKVIKKIMIFEILGIMVSDSVYDLREKEFIKKLSSDLNISMKEIDKMLDYLSKYLAFYKEMYSFILSENE